MAFSIPIQVGGGPDRFERAYSVLEGLVGINGSSKDEDEIEFLWRQAKADGMACLETFDERAAYQISPLTATDHIPLFEETLGIAPEADASDEQRRRAIVPDYTGVPEAWFDALDSSLKRIDPTFEIRIRPWENCATTMIGRWYEPSPFSFAESYDYGLARKGTAWPSYSDMNSLVVELPLGNGAAPSKAQQRKIELARQALNDICPAWLDFQIIHHVGFILDTSLLDATAFGS